MLILAAAQAATLSGRVVDEAGQPLTELTVAAYDLRLAYEATRPAEDGTWVLEDLPEGPWRLRVLPDEGEPRVERFWPEEWSFCASPPLEGDASGLELVLAPSGSISGVLLGPDGQPVAGAQITCSGQDDRVGHLDRRATSAADGSFTVQGLDGEPDLASPWSFWITAAGFPDQDLDGTFDLVDEPPTVDVLLGESTDIGDLTLATGITVSGRLDGEGGPVAGAAVHVYSAGQVVDLVSAADGSYRAEGLPPGQVLPWASLSGYALTYWPDHDRPTDWLDGSAGDVNDADLWMKPEARFNADIGVPDTVVLLYNDAHTVGIGGRSDAEGLVTVDRLHGGSYHLFIYAEDEGGLNDFVREEDGAERVFTVAEGEDAPLVVVELALGAALSGVILDDHGEPVYGAAVSAWPLDPVADSGRATTDRDGRYLIEGLLPGDFLVEADYTPYCEADPDWTEAWSPQVRAEALALPITLPAGEETTVDLVLDRDLDHDGMGDAWEDSVGLDSSRNDAAEDPDEDGLSNLEEYLQGSDTLEDPLSPTGCGCGGGGRSLALLGLLALRRRRA